MSFFSLNNGSNFRRVLTVVLFHGLDQLQQIQNYQNPDRQKGHQ